jgi:hypothetical protein
MRPIWLVDSAVYMQQHARGPAAGLKGAVQNQILPTTFKVKLDFLTEKRGT